MLRRVDLVRSDVSEELSGSVIRVTKIGEVGTLAYELGFYIPEDDILHSHRRENLKSYIAGHCSREGNVSPVR
jgi:hypothetical protein